MRRRLGTVLKILFAVAFVGFGAETLASMGGPELRRFVALAGIYVILAVSLNLICGVTGILQLGHAGFFAVGAYAAGLTAVYATMPWLGRWNLLVGAAAAVLTASVFAVCIGIPCLRLRGDYLAITTLGFGEIIRSVLENVEFPGGAMFPDERIGGPLGIRFSEWVDDVWSEETLEAAASGTGFFGRLTRWDYLERLSEYADWWVIWIAVLLTFVILLNIKRSAAGRAMMCIREDEIAASAMGIDTSRYKLTAFVSSAAFAGVAGALFFHREQSVSPGDFTLLRSIEVLLMVVLGGLGSLTGSVLAAVALVLAPFMLRHYGAAEYTQIAYAVMLIALIRVAPDGLLGRNETPGPLARLFRRADSAEDAA